MHRGEADGCVGNAAQVETTTNHGKFSSFLFLMAWNAKNTRSHAGTATRVTSTDSSSRKRAGRGSQQQKPLTAYRPRPMTRKLSGTCDDRAAAVRNCSRTSAASAFPPDVACARGIRG